MSIKGQISPRIIPSIASLYNDVNRIFMEYIDNSIDSADDHFFDTEKNKYTKPIEITLEILGKNYKDGQVIITDNCYGITNFKKVVQNIGNSDKKAQPWTNGQFGYGIHSFLAACSSLEITSRVEEEKSNYIPILKNNFDVDDQKDFEFPDPKAIHFRPKHGTKIVLSNFNKTDWNNIDMIQLKTEIEKHFELLLLREGITIKFIDNSGKEYICKPFDYDSYEGVVYEASLKNLSYTKGGKNPIEVKELAQKPIRIYLKILEGRVIDKYPVFISKGRRIADIKDIKSFKSKNKSIIWGHPNIIGYIDLSGYLEPTIARNDFKNTDKSKALFNTLLEHEKIILDELKKINKEAESRHYKQLEDRLNSALSKLAKIDAMNYRTENLSGSSINLKPGSSGQEIIEGGGGKDRGETTTNSGDTNLGENQGEGKGEGGEKGDIPGGENQGNFASNEETYEDTGFKGGEKKKSGFNIKIVDDDLQIDDATNKPLRSREVDGEIRIYKKHPDFESRVIEGRQGDKKISQRLITYLAGEITVHYKDLFHTKHGQAEYNKNMFSDLVEFIYHFEYMLKDLADTNLSDLS